MNLRQLLAERITAALATCGAPDAPALVNSAKRPEFGDYQANGVMAAAKRLGKNPRELAQQVIDSAPLDDIAESLSVAGPGFINIRLRTDYIAQRCRSDRVSRGL